MPIKYIPQFDGLRTFAVLLVLIHHWLPEEFFINYLPNGMMGVTLFLVLSGYLITRILVEKSGRSEKFVVLKNFYIRRFLRIFPVFYILLLALYIVNFTGFRAKALWFFTYMQNFFFFGIKNFGGGVGHFWTLAVEEQFYLLWPWVILFFKGKKLTNIVLGFIVLAPIFRAALFLGGTRFGVGILTPSCFDSLCLGAAAAIFEGTPFFIKVKKRINLLLFLSSGVFIALHIFTDYLPALLFHVLFRLSFSFVSIFVIIKAIDGFPGITGKILENKAIVFFGKISYGLYLFHMLVPWIYSKLSEISIKYNLYYPFTEVALFPRMSAYFLWPVYVILLAIISTLSWYIIEKPVNDLKARFDYNKR